MIIQAELKRKQSEYKGEACAVDKVIELPAQRFRQFSRALLVDHDFIAENMLRLLVYPGTSDVKTQFQTSAGSEPS